MKYNAILAVTVAMLPLIGVRSTPAQTRPAAPSADAAVDPMLGKVFRSRTDGIQFNPPAGGAMIRELKGGEIVRFIYTDNSWDVRVKPIPLATPLELSSKPDAGLIELTVDQLKNSNPTMEILRQDVMPVHGHDVGLIQARYNAGTDRVFAQQAIFKDDNQHYLSVQMTSKGSPKAAAAGAPPAPLDADEQLAKTNFEHMIDSVRVLDRQDLAREQQSRVYRTANLWVQIDRKKIASIVQPLRFMRVVRDGKDVGFVQVNERLARHNGNDGVEVIVHSRVQIDQAPARPDTADPTSAASAESTAPSTGVVVPKLIGPVPSLGSVATSQPLAPQTVYTSSTFFVAFDRDHEDWTTLSQTDDDVSKQLTESAYSDRTVHRKLDVAKLKEQPHQKNAQPPVLEVSQYLLNVAYNRGRQKEESADIKLVPFYLPQAIGQLLPRLLPADAPEQYMFAFYVGSQRNVMGRYVDVEPAHDVEIDGQLVRAVPIVDRIGADGIPTTHYVTRQGEWLASVNEEFKTNIYPADEKTLKGIWPNFAVCPVPPVAEEVTEEGSKPIKKGRPLGR